MCVRFQLLDDDDAISTLVSQATIEFVSAHRDITPCIESVVVHVAQTLKTLGAASAVPVVAVSVSF